MGITTRRGKGSTLTNQELDANLEYLEKAELSLISRRISLDDYLFSGNTQMLNGTYVIDYTPSGSTIPIKYGENLEYILEGEYGYSYHINAMLGVFNSAGEYSSRVFNSSLITDKNYPTKIKIGSGFGGGTGAERAHIRAIAIQTDGKILMGGNFTTYSGVTSNYIIRLNANGTIDTSFNIGSGFNSYIKTIAIQTDGKILVGGYFQTYNGVASYNIARLNTNGSKDTSFNIANNFYGYINTITLQSDGKILVGGYVGSDSNYFVRLNADGTIDTSFNFNGSGFRGWTNTIAIQTNGKILIGGFTNSINSVIRLNTDGTTDTSFNIGSGFNGYINTIVIQSDGKILVGGDFQTYNGVASNFIIRLNTDGTIDTSFVTGGGGGGFNADVRTITLQTDGKILVGGSFTAYNGIGARSIIRLNNDGNIDTSFNIYPKSTGFNYANYYGTNIFATVIQTDGKILVGGFFDIYNGTPKNCFIRLNADATNNTFALGDSSYISTSTDSNYKLDVVDNKIHITTNGTIMDYIILNHTLIKTHGEAI